MWLPRQRPDVPKHLCLHFKHFCFDGSLGDPPFGISCSVWASFQLFPPFPPVYLFERTGSSIQLRSCVSHSLSFPPPQLTFLCVICHVRLALDSLCSPGHLQKVHQIWVSLLLETLCYSSNLTQMSLHPGDTQCVLVLWSDKEFQAQGAHVLFLI